MTTFPTSVDTFPTAVDLADDTLATKPHSTLHGNLGDAIVALETKVGVDGSAVTTSLDYRTRNAARVFAFSFAYDTANLNTGVTVYTPAVGDVLLDAWISVTTAFNGTTPKADLGTFVNSSHGLFYWPWDVIDLATADDPPLTPVGDGVRISSGDVRRSISASYVASAAQSAVVDGTANAWQAVFTATNPLKLVVSQDGTPSGSAIGGTTGAGTLYLLVATPTAI